MAPLFSAHCWMRRVWEHPSDLLRTGSERHNLTFIQCPVVGAEGPGASLSFASAWLQRQNLTFIQCPWLDAKDPGASLGFDSDWLRQAEPNSI